MRICTDSTCTRAGELLPEDEFYLYCASTRRMCICKRCHKRRVTVAQRQRRQVERERNAFRPMTEFERLTAIQNAQLDLFQLKTQFQARQKAIKCKLAQLRAAGTKLCRHCRIEMDVEHFYRDKQKLDGRDSYCMECRKERAAA